MTSLKEAAAAHLSDGGLFFLDEADFTTTQPARDVVVFTPTDVQTALLAAEATRALTEALTEKSEPLVIVTIPDPKRPRGWRARLNAGVKTAARTAQSLTETLRTAWTWLTTDAVAEARRARYRGRHHAGIGRSSTAQTNRRVHQGVRESSPSEGVLAPLCDRTELVRWVTLALTARHDLVEVQHPRVRRHFTCS